jgi:hypothetical protein
MSVKSAALSLVIVACPIAAQAQSASQVIARYISAIGGKKALETIVSTEVSGRITSADGRSGAFIQRTKRPYLVYVSMTWGDARWITGFNGRSAWQDDSDDGLRTLFGQAVSRVRTEASYANTRFLTDEKATRMSVARRDEVRGRPVIVVVAVTADGIARALSFDADSHLLVKDEQQTGAAVEERFFDDYRRVDRVMEPHRIEWHRNGETFRVTVERVTHNATIDGQAFDIPARPTEPPLDIDAALSAAARSEQQSAGALASYAYATRETLGRVDEQGRFIQQEGLTHQVFSVGGRPIRRLVRREGQALSEVERRREDERVNTLVQEYERQRSSGQTEPRGPQRPAGHVIVTMPLLGGDWLSVYRRLSDFSSIRREQAGGRTAIVVEFQPKRGVTPNGEFERQTSKMAGTLWIDSASQHVMRIDSYFRDDYSWNVQGSSLRVERALVNDEAWLPVRQETNLRWSFPFGKTAQHLDVVEYIDYKKFNVDTDFTIALPDAKR